MAVCDCCLIFFSMISNVFVFIYSDVELFCLFISRRPNTLNVKKFSEYSLPALAYVPL